MPQLPQHLRWFWIGTGLTVAMALHLFTTALAQGSGGTTFTTSHTTSTSFESPPACSTIGSSRQVQTVTVTNSIGPACLGVGNRDVATPSPACGAAPPAAPPVDPFHGTTFIVAEGFNNVDIQTHTETIECIAAVPVAPWPALMGLGGLLAGGSAWWLRRRRTMP